MSQICPVVTKPGCQLSKEDQIDAMELQGLQVGANPFITPPFRP